MTHDRDILSRALAGDAVAFDAAWRAAERRGDRATLWQLAAAGATWERLALPVEDNLALTVRVYNGLFNRGVRSIGGIVAWLHAVDGRSLVDLAGSKPWQIDAAQRAELDLLALVAGRW